MGRALLLAALLLGACDPAAAATDVLDAGDVDAQSSPDASTDASPDASTDASTDAPTADASADAVPGGDAAAACAMVDDLAPVAIGSAGVGGEHALVLAAASGSTTRWSEAGNEAVVLEVSGSVRGFIGHLVLHQGSSTFAYTMHLGQVAAGEAVLVRVSPLSAAAAQRRACVGAAVLTPASALGAGAEGLQRAPIFRWPIGKRFDDLPVLIGWSRARKSYQAVYTSENGGTVASCGGGADGMQAELARWGRGCDIEGVFAYGGASPTWGRCTGSTSFAQVAPRLESAHPVFYYGDGHNRLFEHRGGYGHTCGSGGAEKTDGDLPGWSIANPGNAEAQDGPHVITLRPLPVDLDTLGFAAFNGRREGLVDVFAPWLYRLTFLELEREGRIDGQLTLPLDRYLYVDVHAADVDGSGDRVCTASVSKGFVLRVTSTGGPVLSGPQMTASYFGADEDWKRLAIPLDRVYASAEITGFIFDAYDNDGIYLLGLGAAFMVRPAGDNGASLDHVHIGEQALAAYVDDDSSGCVAGQNHDGPGGIAYPCVGSAYSFAP